MCICGRSNGQKMPSPILPSPCFLFFPPFFCSIKKIEDGNLCEICLQNFEITAIFALQYGHQELPTSLEKYSHTHKNADFFVSILVCIEYIAKNKKRPTSARSFSSRLMIPERVLFAKRYSMLRTTTPEDKLISYHLKLTGNIRAQHRWPKLQLCGDHMRHAESIRVCMGTFLGGKITVKFSKKTPHLTSRVHRLFSECLFC